MIIGHRENVIYMLSKVSATTLKISEILELDRRNVNHILLELIDEGIITRYKKGKPFVYRLTEHFKKNVEVCKKDIACGEFHSAKTISKKFRCSRKIARTIMRLLCEMRYADYFLMDKNRETFIKQKEKRIDPFGKLRNPLR